MPNHSTPMLTSETHSRFVGCGTPRLRATTPSTAAPTSRRPSESGPAEKSCPKWRMATNALAHSSRVVPTAASGSQVAGCAGAGVAVDVMGEA